ncbi:MAG TPA: xanthine dehydrogenase family protein subunit M [Vicinamibacteria bacterium]|jgi:4-hydroxybenzoyl-CoA reductase subunit beta
MMRLPPFRYLSPRTAAEAARMLADHGAEAMPVAGGTDLYPNMKRRQFEPRVLVGLRRLEDARAISGNGQEGIEIGGLATLTELADSELLRSSYPAIARAAGLVSSPILRNMGTVGGNLCIDTRCNYYNQNYEWREAIHFCMKKDGETCWVAPGSDRCWAVSSSDTAPVFMVLGAEVTLVGAKGERRIPVRDLYKPDGIDFTTKRRDEILTKIHVPPIELGRATYLKLRRRGSIDFPILGVAASLKTASDGTVERCRIVLTAVESAPVEAREAERMVVGHKLTDELIREVAAAAYRPAKPLDNTDLTHAYRKKMARVFVARALAELSAPEKRQE